MALDANGIGVPVAVFNRISITRITISDRHPCDARGFCDPSAFWDGLAT
jgi:hypothetical protein